MTTTKQPATAPAARRRRRWVRPVAIGALLFAALAAAGVIWFFSGDAPAEVDLESAAEAVASDSTVATTTGGDPSGTWVIDTRTGTFSFEEATASFAGFRVDEQLANIGATTAVGRSPEVSGTVVIEGTTLTAATIEVDLTAIVSDESRREDEIQEALGTGQWPTATFVLTAPVDLGDGAGTGETITVDAIGELTVAGVANTVTIPLQAQLIDGQILVVGSTDIVFADYGITVPSAPVVLSVEDHGTLEIQLWLSRS